MVCFAAYGADPRPAVSIESIYLFVVLLLALAAFYAQWLRPDVTALLVMISLIVPWRPTTEGLRGILEPADAFHGFGSPALIMVAAMFVLSAAMVRTGAAQLLGGRIMQAGSGSELRFQMTVLGIITLFSAVINDTTTVLVWMPLVMAVCRERGYAPSRILLLLAYASLLGGQWTLIGTRSNVILSDYLRSRTGEELGFFSFTPIAALVFAACVIWFVLVGRRMLPAAGDKSSLESRYEVAEYLTETMAQTGSEIVGKTLDELDLPHSREVTVLQVIRGKEFLPPSPWLRIQAGDVLVIQGRITAITDVLARPGMQVREELKIDDKTLRSADLRMVEAVLPPDSQFERRSLRDLDFHRQYGVSPLAISRAGRSLKERPLTVPLRSGDSLLLVGHEQEIQRLRRNRNLLLLESRPLPSVGRLKAFLVLGIMATMVLSCALGLLQPAIAIPMAAMAAILSRSVGMRTAYESMDLQALVIVGAMIPFGEALATTGTAQWIADHVAAGLDGSSPQLLLGVLLLLAVLLTQLIENSAVAVILAPIAYELAVASGCDPKPFLLGVAICVSTAFMTPMAHESTILVMGPGRYRFADYLRLGTPFALLTWLVTTVAVPWFHPLR
jgi:di/tricarboxylate transporter